MVSMFSGSRCLDRAIQIPIAMPMPMPMQVQQQEQSYYYYYYDNNNTSLPSHQQISPPQTHPYSSSPSLEAGSGSRSVEDPTSTSSLPFIDFLGVGSSTWIKFIFF